MGRNKVDPDDVGNIVMEYEDTGRKLKRRQYLAIVGALAGSPALAGCTGQGGGDGTPTAGGDGSGGGGGDGSGGGGGGDGSGGGDQQETTQSGGGSSGEPKKGGTLQSTLESPVIHFDHHLTGLLVGSTTGYQMHEKLFEPTRQLGLQNLLAKEIEQTDDGLTWDIHLHEGVMFHPPFKKEFTAEDAVFNLDRVNNPDTGSFRRGGLQVIKSWEAADKYTLRLQFDELHTSTPFWLGGYFGITMFSPEAIQEYGDMKDHPVGTGPFIFDNWEPRTEIAMVKNEDYWQEGLPHVDKVVFKPITEASVQVTELLDGQIDMLRKTPSDFISRLQNNDRVNVQTAQGGGYRALHINPMPEPTKNRAGDTPTTNRKVRHAILEAIDRNAMAEIIHGGFALPTQNYFPPNHPWHVDYAPFSMGANPEKANQLLDEAGFDNPTLHIVGASDDQTLKQLAEITRDGLAKANFDPQVSLYEIGTWANHVNNWQFDIASNYFTTFLYPVSLRAWVEEGFLPLQPPSWIKETETGQKVHELFNKIDSTQDEEQRMQFNEELQKLLVDAASYVPVLHPQKVQTHTNSVKNFKIHPFHTSYELDTVWLDE